MQALGGRISIPLSSIRGRLAQMSKKVALDIEAASPGLRVRGEAHALGAPIAFAARIDADGVHIEGENRTVRIRLSDVELSTREDAPGPLADAIRNGTAPEAEIAIGHLSASLCHLGNLATRLGRSLRFDPETERIIGDDEADGLVKRTYRDHWGAPKGV